MYVCIGDACLMYSCVCPNAHRLWYVRVLGIVVLAQRQCQVSCQCETSPLGTFMSCRIRMCGQQVGLLHVLAMSCNCCACWLVSLCNQLEWFRRPAIVYQGYSVESFVSGSHLCIVMVMFPWGCISPKQDTNAATWEAKGILLQRSLCLNLIEVMLKLGSLSALVVTCVHGQLTIQISGSPIA